MTGDEVPLRRVLSLPMLTLYGVGTIVGAGFYALLGKVAGLAGMAAPSAVLLAALVSSFTALSFAELATRYPESGGPVRYIRAAFDNALLSHLTGVLVIATGVVSAATLARAVGGFLEGLHGLSPTLTTTLTVAGLCGIAGWGVRATSIFAVTITVLEVGVLVAIPLLRADALPELPVRALEFLPTQGAPWSGVLAGAFLIFYAFVGFEDMVTLAEEVEDPSRNIPRAILGTLLVTTILYVTVSAVAVIAEDPDVLAADSAPLALLVGERAATLSAGIVWVGVLAGLNGALIQIVMASRIIHGMRTERGPLAWIGAVHPRTRTPLRATAIIGLVVLALALRFPLVALASWTSAALLVVFASVNAALVVIARRGPEYSGFRCPRWVPVVGFFLCVGLLTGELVRRFGS